MYGGKMDSTGNVSSQLWVFHVQNQTWVLLNPRVKEQYAAVGHSAHVVPPLQEGDAPVMLVLFGHCPLYGYMSLVQEYNIRKSDEPDRSRVMGSWGHGGLQTPFFAVDRRPQPVERGAHRRGPDPGRLRPQQRVRRRHPGHLRARRLQGVQRQQVRPGRRPLPAGRGHQEVVSE